MFSATNARNTAKTRFSGLGSIACANRAPQGVVINVIAMIRPKAGRFTAPRL